MFIALCCSVFSFVKPEVSPLCLLVFIRMMLLILIWLSWTNVAMQIRYFLRTLGGKMVSVSVSADIQGKKKKLEIKKMYHSIHKYVFIFEKFISLISLCVAKKEGGVSYNRGDGGRWEGAGFLHHNHGNSSLLGLPTSD